MKLFGLATVSALGLTRAIELQGFQFSKGPHFGVELHLEPKQATVWALPLPQSYLEQPPGRCTLIFQHTATVLGGSQVTWG